MIRGMIDLDNTVSNWVGWVSKTLGRKPMAFKDRRIEEAYGIDGEEARRLVNDGDGYGGSVSPVAGAAAALSGVYRTGKFIFNYVSAAPQEFQSQRLLWMVKHKFPIDPNNKLGATLLHVGSSLAKREWLAERKNLIGFVIDDDPSIITIAYELGIPTRILIASRFNRHLHYPATIRTRHWSAIQSMLLALL